MVSAVGDNGSPGTRQSRRGLAPADAKPVGRRDLLRRREAQKLLADEGHLLPDQALAKAAWRGGGPLITYIGSGPRPTPYYERESLLAWAASLVSAPVRRARDVRAERVAS